MSRWFNIYRAVKDQLPWSRLLRNIRNGNIKGVLHRRSHYNGNGTPKVTYNTKATAEKSARKMSEKHNARFSNYKCFHCDGYHIGKSRA